MLSQEKEKERRERREARKQARLARKLQEEQSKAVEEQPEASLSPKIQEKPQIKVRRKNVFRATRPATTYEATVQNGTLREQLSSDIKIKVVSQSQKAPLGVVTEEG